MRWKYLKIGELLTSFPQFPTKYFLLDNPFNICVLWSLEKEKNRKGIAEIIG